MADMRLDRWMAMIDRANRLIGSDGMLGYSLPMLDATSGGWMGMEPDSFTREVPGKVTDPYVAQGDRRLYLTDETTEKQIVAFLMGDGRMRR